VAKDYKTGVVYKFGPDHIEQFVRSLNGQVVIGHNIINFDIPALETWVLDNMTPELLPASEMVIDTLVLSRLLNPDRERPEGLPQKVGPHSLQAWGYRVGTHKGDYGKQDKAFDEYNEDMLAYCVQDTEVTEKVYKALLEEMKNV